MAPAKEHTVLAASASRRRGRRKLGWAAALCFGFASQGPRGENALASTSRRRNRTVPPVDADLAVRPAECEARRGADDEEEEAGKGPRVRCCCFLPSPPRLPAERQVSNFRDAKKPNRSKPRPIADGAAPSGTTQPQASATATGTRGSTAPARPGSNQTCTTTTTDVPVMAGGRIWRAPSHQQPVRAERPASASGLWTAATTLGVIVLFGRVTAVVFLCSYLYGVRFVRARAAGAGASAKSSGVAGASSTRQVGDPIFVASEKVAELCVTEECKKKVVMAGLLERAGRRPSSRFGR